MIENGTIDITDVVEKMKETFVLAAKQFLVNSALAIPGIGAIAAWFIKVLASEAIEWGLRKLSNWSVMQAFFLNTAIRKGAQAADYVKTVAAKESLPPTATDEDYYAAEQAEILAFDRFVSLTN